MSSTREYLNARAFSSAQWAYDNMSPPDGGPCECAECNGSGQVDGASGIDGDLVDCPCCGGAGLIDENGNPWIEPEDEDRSY